MTQLRELPDGAMYVCRNGDEIGSLDHHGRYYPPTPPAPAQASQSKPKPLTLSESARAEIQAMLPELMARPSEVTLWCVVDHAGDLLESFATSSGHEDCDRSDHRDSLMRVVKTPKAAGLWLAHTHPRFSDGSGGGKPEASADDVAFTRWVEAQLQPRPQIRLLDHHILAAESSASVSITEAVVGEASRTPEWDASIARFCQRLEARYGLRPTDDGERTIEAAPLPTDWDRRQAEAERQPAWFIKATAALRWRPR